MKLINYQTNSISDVKQLYRRVIIELSLVQCCFNSVQKQSMLQSSSIMKQAIV